MTSTSFARLAVTAAMLLLGGCGDGRLADAAAAANAAAPTATADAPAIHYVRASTDPHPRNGYCTLGACAWFETRSQQVVGSTEHERQVRVTLATGRSEHPDEDYPINAARAPVRWSGSEEAWVFCSRWRPSVRRLRGRQWQQARADLVGGMGDFEAPTRSIYGLVCHLEDDWTAAGFFARNGYRAQPGEPVSDVAQPQEPTYIHPHDPNRPEMGGVAVSHSAPAPVTATLAAPPAAVPEYRPPPRPRAPFHLLIVSSEGEFVGAIGSYSTLEACERERGARTNVETRTVCIDGESGIAH